MEANLRTCALPRAPAHADRQLPENGRKRICRDPAVNAAQRRHPSRGIGLPTDRHFPLLRSEQEKLSRQRRENGARQPGATEASTFTLPCQAPARKRQRFSRMMELAFGPKATTWIPLVHHKETASSHNRPSSARRLVQTGPLLAAATGPRHSRSLSSPALSSLPSGTHLEKHNRAAPLWGVGGKARLARPRGEQSVVYACPQKQGGAYPRRPSRQRGSHHPSSITAARRGDPVPHVAR